MTTGTERKQGVVINNEKAEAAVAEFNFTQFRTIEPLCERKILAHYKIYKYKM